LYIQRLVLQGERRNANQGVPVFRLQIRQKIQEKFGREIT
jgi:hypothetical protein